MTNGGMIDLIIDGVRESLKTCADRGIICGYRVDTSVDGDIKRVGVSVVVKKPVDHICVDLSAKGE